jgi:hypothetical protein
VTPALAGIIRDTTDGGTTTEAVEMAMTLRLTEAETEALRAQAEREGRSMQEVVRTAIRNHIRMSRVADSATRGAERYAEVLRRLADA